MKHIKKQQREANAMEGMMLHSVLESCLIAGWSLWLFFFFLLHSHGEGKLYYAVTFIWVYTRKNFVFGTDIPTLKG